MPTRLQIAAPDIIQQFNDGPRVLAKADIQRLLREKRAFWRLAESTTASAFISFLKDKGQLEEIRFEFPYRPTTRFTWGAVPLLELVQSINQLGYFSHFSAMQIHGLTDQTPKTIYLNIEQHLSGGGTLTQSGIDQAFRRKCRVSKNSFVLEDQTVTTLNGRNTGQMGVVEVDPENGAKLRVTNVEKTLIDIAVRPVYSGGIYQVAEAYRAAQGSVSVNRLVAFLRRLNFTYPYHQSIGFYMERAGNYSPDQIALLRDFDREFDFYIDYALKEVDYSEEWKLFIPKGF